MSPLKVIATMILIIAVFVLFIWLIATYTEVMKIVVACVFSIIFLAIFYAAIDSFFDQHN